MGDWVVWLVCGCNAGYQCTAQLMHITERLVRGPTVGAGWFLVLRYGHSRLRDGSGR